MTAELDKLFYTLGINNAPAKASIAETEAEVEAAGVRIRAKTSQFFSQTSAGSANLLRMKQSIQDTFGEGEKAITKAHGAASTATREFRALFDELSSGRTRMAPGTLAIIATRVFGISGATLAWGAAMAAIPIAFAVAAVSAENAMDRAEHAILRTNYAAGVTTAQLARMAQQLDTTGRISERGGLDVLGILSSRGNIQSANLERAGLATAGYAGASGLTLDKAAAQFEKILSDPAKGAQELNSEFKLLTVAQTRQIEELERSGNIEKAQQIIIDATIGRFGHLEDSAWSLSKAFTNIGRGLSDWWFHTGEKIAGMPQNELAADQSRLAALRSKQALPLFPGEEAQLASRVAELAKNAAAEAAKAAAGEARVKNNNAIGLGMADVDKTDTFNKHLRDLREEFARDDSAVKSAEATHSKFTSALIRQRDAVELALKNQKTPEELARQAADDARTIARASLDSRGRVQAEIAARREYERNLANPETSLQAKSIYDAQLQQARYNLADARRAQGTQRRTDTGNDVANIEARNQERLVAAYRQSIQAGERMQAQIDAEVAKRRGEISDINAYVEAKTREAQAKREIAAIKEDRQMDAENASLRLQISLIGADDDLRKRKIAELELENQLVQKGWDLNSAAGQAELAIEKQKLDAKLQYQKVLKDAATAQQNDMSLMQEGMGMFSNVLSQMNGGAQAMKNILPSLERDIATLIEKLAILNPLENMLTGAITGTPGTAPTIGGGIFSSAWNWISNQFRFGGAWSSGVRFAAQGMVLNGPTMFGTAGGPVIGGEMGPGSEALMPLARGPGGLGVRVHGSMGSVVHVHQNISIHPDVSAVARQEIYRQLPHIQTAAIAGVKAAQSRGVPTMPGQR